MKGFKTNVVFRVLLILALSLLLAWILLNRQWFFTPLVVGLLLLLTTSSLIMYVERTSQNLTQFLLNVKQGGFTSTFSKDRKGASSRLSDVFNDVLVEFQRISMEKESNYQYLKTLNENIGVSLISFDKDGVIALMNPAAKILLKKPFLRNISELESIDLNLHKSVTHMESGDREVIKVVIDGELVQLSIQMKKFIAQEKAFNLLIFQNMNTELEQKEIEAWQKLISVLTHEIMNSVTPIASLSEALNKQFGNEGQLKKLNKEDHEDIITSLDTIESRSKSLMKFVNAYKEFSKSPELNLSEFDLRDLVQRVLNLFQPDLNKNNIVLNYEINSKPISIRADYDLMEQVVINLIKNSMDAMNNVKEAKLKIVVIKNIEAVLLRISDNGHGISAEGLERIFVPFYTTKKHGTGVGLSFARKVMRLHNGSISVQTKENQGTSFTLAFNNLL